MLFRSVGDDRESDLQTVRLLRDALGPGVLLRADGNQGYSEESARRFLGDVRKGDLELLEQPTPAADLQALRRLADEFELPIMADESVKDAADAGRLAEARIGIAAALHFALATPGVERADLDGHLDIADDVARGGVRIEGGDILPLLDADGLGVVVRL